VQLLKTRTRGATPPIDGIWSISTCTFSLPLGRLIATTIGGLATERSARLSHMDSRGLVYERERKKTRAVMGNCDGIY